MLDNLQISLAEYFWQMELSIMEQNISTYATIRDVHHLFLVKGGPKLKAFIVDSLNGSSEFSSTLLPLSNYKSPIISPAPEDVILLSLQIGKNFSICYDCFEKRGGQFWQTDNCFYVTKYHFIKVEMAISFRMSD